MLKPTGWVVDMRHYVDEETGDLPESIPLCGDNGLIHGWEETLWNRHGGAHAPPNNTSPTTRH